MFAPELASQWCWPGSIFSGDGPGGSSPFSFPAGPDPLSSSCQRKSAKKDVPVLREVSLNLCRSEGGRKLTGLRQFPFLFPLCNKIQGAIKGRDGQTVEGSALLCSLCRLSGFLDSVPCSVHQRKRPAHREVGLVAWAGVQRVWRVTSLPEMAPRISTSGREQGGQTVGAKRHSHPFPDYRSSRGSRHLGRIYLC